MQQFRTAQSSPERIFGPFYYPGDFQSRLTTCQRLHNEDIACVPVVIYIQAAERKEIIRFPVEYFITAIQEKHIGRNGTFFFKGSVRVRYLSL